MPDRDAASTTPTRRRPSRRAALISAAVDEFGATTSLEAVTAAQIAARTGMGLSAFYYHFASIDALLEAVVEALFNGISTRSKPRPDEVDLATWASASMQRQLDWISDRPGEARLLVAISGGSPGGPAVLSAVHGRLTTLSIEVGRDLVALDPRNDELTSEILARSFISLVTEVASLAFDGIAPDRSELRSAAMLLAHRLVTPVAA